MGVEGTQHKRMLNERYRSLPCVCALRSPPTKLVRVVDQLHPSRICLGNYSGSPSRITCVKSPYPVDWIKVQSSAIKNIFVHIQSAFECFYPMDGVWRQVKIFGQLPNTQSTGRPSIYKPINEFRVRFRRNRFLHCRIIRTVILCPQNVCICGCFVIFRFCKLCSHYRFLTHVELGLVNGFGSIV